MSASSGRMPRLRAGLANALSGPPLSCLCTEVHSVEGEERVAVYAHAAAGGVLVTMTDHVTLETPTHVIHLPTRFAFTPLHLAVDVADDHAVVIVAGPDGAHAAVIDLVTHQIRDGFAALPPTHGHAIVCVAVTARPLAVVAAGRDGRVAVWHDLHAAPAVALPVDPVSFDRVTDLALLHDCVLVAWWSGRLQRHHLATGAVTWEIKAVEAPQECYGRFPGSYLCVRDSRIALVTGRGHLVFVSLHDGAHIVNHLSGYVKGICDTGVLRILVDGKLVQRRWVTSAHLAEHGKLIKPPSHSDADTHVNRDSTAEPYA